MRRGRRGDDATVHDVNLLRQSKPTKSNNKSKRKPAADGTARVLRRKPDLSAVDNATLEACAPGAEPAVMRRGRKRNADARIEKKGVPQTRKKSEYFMADSDDGESDPKTKRQKLHARSGRQPKKAQPSTHPKPAPQGNTTCDADDDFECGEVASSMAQGLFAPKSGKRPTAPKSGKGPTALKSGKGGTALKSGKDASAPKSRMPQRKQKPVTAEAKKPPAGNAGKMETAQPSGSRPKLTPGNKRKRSSPKPEGIASDSKKVDNAGGKFRSKSRAKAGRGTKTSKGTADTKSPEKKKRGTQQRGKEDILAILREQEEKRLHVAGAKKPGDESENSDWEEVEDLPVDSTPTKSQLPAGSVEVTLQGPAFNQKKNKKKEQDPSNKFFGEHRRWEWNDWQEYIRQQLNRFRKETQLCVHKVHLLCLVARGFWQNTVCSQDLVQAVALSLVPAHLTEVAAEAWTIPRVEKFTAWFSKTFVVDSSLEPVKAMDQEAVLLSRLGHQRAATGLELVMLFVVTLRALQLNARLVLSLQPASHKAQDLVGKNQNALELWVQQYGSTSKQRTDSSARRSRSPPVTAAQSADQKSDGSRDKGKGKKAGVRRPPLKLDTLEPKAAGKGKSRAKRPAKEKTGVPSSSKRPRRVASTVNYAESDKEDGNDEDLEDKRKVAPKARKTKAKAATKCDNDSDSMTELSSDSDFDDDETEYRSPRPPSSNRKPRKKESSFGHQGTDEWSEVYLVSEERWITVDVVRGKVITKQPEVMEKVTSKGMRYVVAYDNDNSIKDVTRRYALKWAATIKLVPDKAWWQRTLGPYKSLDVERNSQEDNKLHAQLMEKSLPTSESEFRNHPLYILKKHLHKYDAIYPNTAIPVGYFKGEPVYARECVQTLHSRENWLKEGLSVKLHEEPYKWVKSKKRKQGRSVDSMLDLYGHWQTETYVSPPAVDGKVPRNAYGNVDMYKPWMLPPGTVHLKLPGLNRVARKLRIDCPRAMLGWDLHHGYTHPVLDGFIVCVEHQEALTAAWEEDQMIQLQKEAEKKQQRVINNWKLLVSGLLIREKAKKKFALNPADKGQHSDIVASASISAETPQEVSKKATDASMAWPQNRQQAKKEPSKKPSKAKGRGKKSHEQKHLFPFEIEEL